MLGVTAQEILSACVVAIPSCIAAWKANTAKKQTDTGNGIKLGPLVYALDAKMDSLVTRVTRLENGDKLIVISKPLEDVKAEEVK